MPNNTIWHYRDASVQSRIQKLSADQMHTAMEECDSGVALEVCVEIAKIASDYIHLLDQYSEAVEYLCELLQEVANESIEYDDWENVVSLVANLKAGKLVENKDYHIQLEKNILNKLL